MKYVVEFGFVFLLGAIGFWAIVVTIGLIYGLLILPFWALLTWRRKDAKG
jgi:hypothetical protein